MFTKYYLKPRVVWVTHQDNDSLGKSRQNIQSGFNIFPFKQTLKNITLSLEVSTEKKKKCQSYPVDSSALELPIP